MKKNKFVVSIFLLFLVFYSANAKENTNSKPNIVFIICDDLNDAITHLGEHSQTITPNI